MSPIKHLLLALSAFVSIGNAGASLLSIDYEPNSGDGWITRDSNSGLDWLDVSLTANQTFDQVRTGPWVSQGFRYATLSEVRTLFDHAGTPDDWFDVSVTAPDQTLLLAQLLGPTLLTPERVSVHGLIGTDWFDNDVTFENHPIGDVFNAVVAKIDYIDLPPDGPIGESHFTGWHPFSNEAAPFYGSFLVRSVPEPSTGSIAVLALVALASVRQSTRARDSA